jgi:hypothetical protein
MPSETTDPMDTIPHYVFWREGCTKITKYACYLIRMAGDPVTPAAIMKFMSSAPRDRAQLLNDDWRRGYCSMVMERSNAVADGMADQEGWNEAFCHFVDYLPARKWDTAEMLIETVAGVMGGLDLDAPPTPAPNIPRSRSFRERWSKFVNKTVR